jgi:hypothetical protein
MANRSWKPNFSEPKVSPWLEYGFCARPQTRRGLPIAEKLGFHAVRQRGSHIQNGSSRGRICRAGWEKRGTRYM